MKAVASILVVFTIFFETTHAQEMVSKDSIIFKLKALRNSISSLDTITNKISSEVLSSRKIINDWILAINQKDIVFPVEYRKALDYFIRAVEQGRDFSAVAQRENLLVIKKDLSLKFFRNTAGNLASGINNKLAKIKVVTRNSKSSVNNLRIKCSPLGMKIDYSKPFRVFSKLSSPVIDELAPGYYRFWATKTDSADVLDFIDTEIRPGDVNEIELAVSF